MQKPKRRFTLPVLIGIVGVCAVCACGVGILLYFYGDNLIPTIQFGPADVPTSTPTAAQPAGVTPTMPPIPAMAEWTVIVYSAADDQVLEGPQWFDVNEMELAGSTPEVNIVVQIDRYNGAFSGDGNWTEARRYYVVQDNDLDHINSPIIQSMGEVDMGDPQTLVDFVSWAVQNFPAQKYALIMSDHGGGWIGGFSDGSSDSRLSMPEIANALGQIEQNTGLDAFEVFGFDACLMGQIEVFGSLYPYANYMVASEEVIPSMGYSYAGFLRQLVQNPSMAGDGLSQAIVSTYVVDDTELANASADAIAQEESTTTLSALDSSRVPELIQSMNQFIAVMATTDQRAVAEARTYARGYYSVFGEDGGASYIDLVNFAQVLADMTGDPQLQQAADQLQASVAAAVVAEKHGSRMEGSSGVSFYFPNSDLYSFTVPTDNASISYIQATSAYLERSSWDEFMAYHYAGVAFVPEEGQTITPASTVEIVGPGASNLVVAPIQITDTQITGDELVTVSTSIEGNVAYIYAALYFYSPDTNAYWIGDITYYTTGKETEVDGVILPNYGESPVEVEFDYNPTLYILTDGSHEAYALFEPAEYQNAQGQMVYAVFGQYTPTGSNTPLDARLYFDSYGNYLYAYAFPDPDNDGASNPVEITLKPGDHFTDYVQVIAFDENNQEYYDYSPSQDVWTWGDQGFSFYPAYVVDGQYAVGVIAVDFDGNIASNFVDITYTYSP